MDEMTTPEEETTTPGEGAPMPEGTGMETGGMDEGGDDTETSAV